MKKRATKKGSAKTSHNETLVKEIDSTEKANAADKEVFKEREKESKEYVENQAEEKDKEIKEERISDSGMRDDDDDGQTT